MEQIVVTLSPFTRRCRSFALSHRMHALSRGLEPDEHVLIRDPHTDEHFNAVVRDVDFEMDDTVYRLDLGARITAEEADEWMSPTLEKDRLTTRDIVDLLAELRRGERAMAAAIDDLRAP